MEKPSILYLTPCWPHAKAFGSQMRVLHTARALARMGDLRLAVVDSVGADEAAMDKTKSEFDVECEGELRRLPNGSITERWRRAINPRIANPHGVRAEEPLRGHVLAALRRFDLIWATNLRTTSAFDHWRWPRSVMDIDDVPSTFERTVSKNGADLVTRLRARWRSWIWARHERLLSERFSVLGVCSEPDRRYLAAKVPVHVLPNGFEPPAQSPRPRPSVPARLGFIGQFDYRPNAEGVQWFHRECWPEIKRLHPNTRLRLVGKGTDGPLKPNGPGVDGLGWVADPTEEMASWSAMIVPVRFGAGTRLKVLEAFSRKCPVVSTRLGAFGHDITHGTELLLADLPAAFAGACVRLIQQPEQAAALAERAWQRFVREWTWDAVTPRIWAAAEDCLRLTRKSAAETGPISITT